MFDAAALAEIRLIAERYKIDPAALQAVAEVESAGKVFALVKGRKEPLIRFEGHYFDQRLKEPLRSAARQQGLASSTAGKVRNPSDQPGRWAVLTKAARIDKQAALESISIGVGQVMTAHWAKLGFADVTEMIAEARKGAAGQVEIMARYIAKFGLVDELRRLDFTAFARGYNGPGFRKYGYHLKIAEAYARISGEAPVSAATGMLRMGSKGAKVRELQALLVRAGHLVKADGDFGPTTRDAVRSFQKANRIRVDGVAGPDTFRRLEAFKVSPDEQMGAQPATEVKEVRDAAKGLGPIAVIMSIRDQIAETAGWLLGIDADAAQTVASVLMAGTAAIGVGLAAWGLLGWWRSRQTDEGDVPA